MYLSRKNEFGEKYLIESTTGKKVQLQRVAPNKGGRIPNNVFGKFIKPQERGINKVATIIKE